MPDSSRAPEPAAYRLGFRHPVLEALQLPLRPALSRHPLELDAVPPKGMR